MRASLEAWGGLAQRGRQVIQGVLARADCRNGSRTYAARSPVFAAGSSPQDAPAARTARQESQESLAIPAIQALPAVGLQKSGSMFQPR